MKKKKSYWTIQFRSVRQIWSRSNPARKECLLRAKLIPVDGLQKWECAICEKSFALSEVEVDHIIPVGNNTPTTREEFDIAFNNLHSDDLQVICKGCHKIKSKHDNHNKRYNEAVLLIANYLHRSVGYVEAENQYVEHHLKNWETIQKFSNIIKKIQFSDESGKAKYMKKLDKLKEKYL